MEKSYVYFWLSSASWDNIDTNFISEKLWIKNSIIHPKWKKDNYSRKLQTQKEEYLNINNLIEEITNQLYDKIDIINQIKNELKLVSILEIVLCINTNESISKPYIWHNSKTIEFLHKTWTTTDVDIYTFTKK